MPRHVAVMPDGHRRHAAAAGGSWSDWYRAGAEKGLEVVGWCIECGVRDLSVFAISRHNVEGRARGEVGVLFDNLLQVCTMLDATPGVNVNVFGDLERIPDWVEAKQDLIALSGGPKGEQLTVYMAANYAGEDDFRELASKVGGGAPGEPFSRLLLSAEVPPVDLVVRTGGRKRLSGFLPFQIAHAELYFTDTMWPAFSRDEFERALAWYATQDRTFGV